MKNDKLVVLFLFDDLNWQFMKIASVFVEQFV